MSNIVTTNDLGIVCALISSGYNYSSVERKDKIVKFIFVSPGNELDMVVAAYWQDKLMVSALKYHNTMRSLKNLIYNSP